MTVIRLVHAFHFCNMLPVTLLLVTSSMATAMRIPSLPSAATDGIAAGINLNRLMPPFPADRRDPLLLTPYITADDLETARNLSRVRGSKLLDQVESYAGFLTINATDFSNMFFWYFPAEKPVTSTSVILWLEGGPGAASSMNVLLDNGPFTVDDETQQIVKRDNYYWSQEHHVIYMDQPLGVGYSFTAPSGRPTTIEESTDDLYAALVQFYSLFPHLRDFPLYLAGQSYSGKFIPALARHIGESNEKYAAQSKLMNISCPPSPGDSTTGACRLIPLEGLIIGNPMVHPKENFFYGDFLYGHGMLDEAQKNYFNAQARHAVRFLESEYWEDSVDIMDKLIFGAFHNDTYFKRVTGFEQYHSVRGPRDTYLFTPTYGTAEAFLQSADTRTLLNVGDMPFLSFSEDILRNFKEDMAMSQLDNLEYALNSYRVLLYFGNLDIICNFEAGRRVMNSAKNWSRHEDWLRAVQKPWKPNIAKLVQYELVDAPGGDGLQLPPFPHLNDEVTFGFVTHLPRQAKSRSEFVFLVILGAAHSVMQDHPQLMQYVLNAFLRGDQF